MDGNGMMHDNKAAYETFECARCGATVAVHDGAAEKPPILCARCSQGMRIAALEQELMAERESPIPIRLECPSCGELHIDEGAFATKPHHTHACQHCGHVWRPAVRATVGVRFLPGFKNGS
jgi:transcription elongation factor Elf1